MFVIASLGGRLPLCLLGLVMGLNGCTNSSQPISTSISAGPTPAELSSPLGTTMAVPTAPSASPTSSGAIVPSNWQWLSQAPVRIAIPENYVGGTPTDLQDEYLARSGIPGKAALLGQYITSSQLWAIDKTTIRRTHPTTLLVAKDSSPTPLGAYTKAAQAALAKDWQLSPPEKISLGGRDFLRLQGRGQGSTQNAALVAYITWHYQHPWIILFTTGADQLPNQHQDFRRIAASLGWQ